MSSGKFSRLPTPPENYTSSLQKQEAAGAVSSQTNEAVATHCCRTKCSRHTERWAGCSAVTFLKAHANTCTQLRLLKILQLFLVYMQVSKTFSCSLCFNVKTTAIFVIITSLHWDMFFP